ncbi:MAG: anion permease [Gammaproteobacteria bacterium]|nr:anion permease [Gammaproteobacteria bacterium]
MNESNLSQSSVLKAGAGLGFFGQFWNNIIESGHNPKKTLIGFVLAWTFFLLILFVMPTPEGLTPAGKACLAVVVWACITWISESVPVGITGILIPMLLILSGATTKFDVAVGGFISNAAFLCLIAFLLAAVIQAAGLDRRLALGLLHRAKVKTVNGVIWAMFGVNFVLALIVPGANPRAALQLPVIKGITDLLGNTPEEREAKKAIVIQSMVYGSMIAGMCIMTAHLPNLILVGLFESKLKLEISYFEWFQLQWPYMGMFVITQWWIQYYFKTHRRIIAGGAEAINKQHSALPKMTQAEWLILACFTLTAILWMTEEFTKIKSHVAAMIGLALLFIPGLFNFKWKDIQDRTIWGTFLMLGGALSMSAVMGKTGLAQWLADYIHPVVTGYPWWAILLVMMVGTHIIRLGMLSNVAAIALFAPILLELAPKFGLHPVAFTMLVADTDTFAYILPTQVTVAVIAYSSGTFSMADYAKVGWVSVLLAITYGIVVMVPWYAYMGIPLWDPSAPWPF